LKSTNTPAGSVSMARLNRSACLKSLASLVLLLCRVGTADCVTCNATSGSDGDVTCTRRRASPPITRCADQFAGTVSAYPPLDQKSRCTARCRRAVAADRSYSRPPPRPGQPAPQPPKLHAATHTTGRCAAGEFVSGNRTAWASCANRASSTTRAVCPLSASRTAAAIQRRDAEAPRPRSARRSARPKSATVVSERHSGDLLGKGSQPRRAWNRNKSLLLSSHPRSTPSSRRSLQPPSLPRRWMPDGATRARLHHGAIRGGGDHTDTRRRPPRWVHDDHRFRRVGAPAVQ